MVFEKNHWINDDDDDPDDQNNNTMIRVVKDINVEEDTDKYVSDIVESDDESQDGQDVAVAGQNSEEDCPEYFAKTQDNTPTPSNVTLKREPVIDSDSDTWENLGHFETGRKTSTESDDDPIECVDLVTDDESLHDDPVAKDLEALHSRSVAVPPVKRKSLDQDSTPKKIKTNATSGIKARIIYSKETILEVPELPNMASLTPPHCINDECTPPPVSSALPSPVRLLTPPQDSNLTVMDANLHFLEIHDMNIINEYGNMTIKKESDTINSDWRMDHSDAEKGKESGKDENNKNCSHQSQHSTARGETRKTTSRTDTRQHYNVNGHATTTPENGKGGQFSEALFTNFRESSESSSVETNSPPANRVTIAECPDEITSDATVPRKNANTISSGTNIHATRANIIAADLSEHVTSDVNIHAQKAVITIPESGSACEPTFSSLRQSDVSSSSNEEKLRTAVTEIWKALKIMDVTSKPKHNLNAEQLPEIIEILAKNLVPNDIQRWHAVFKLDVWKYIPEDVHAAYEKSKRAVSMAEFVVQELRKTDISNVATVPDSVAIEQQQSPNAMGTNSYQQQFLNTLPSPNQPRQCEMPTPLLTRKEQNAHSTISTPQLQTRYPSQAGHNSVRNISNMLEPACTVTETTTIKRYYEPSSNMPPITDRIIPFNYPGQQVAIQGQEFMSGQQAGMQRQQQAVQGQEFMSGQQVGMQRQQQAMQGQEFMSGQQGAMQRQQQAVQGQEFMSGQQMGMQRQQQAMQGQEVMSGQQVGMQRQQQAMQGQEFMSGQQVSMQTRQAVMAGQQEAMQRQQQAIQGQEFMSGQQVAMQTRQAVMAGQQVPMQMQQQAIQGQEFMPGQQVAMQRQQQAMQGQEFMSGQQVSMQTRQAVMAGQQEAMQRQQQAIQGQEFMPGQQVAMQRQQQAMQGQVFMSRQQVAMQTRQAVMAGQQVPMQTQPADMSRHQVAMAMQGWQLHNYAPTNTPMQGQQQSSSQGAQYVTQGQPPNSQIHGQPPMPGQRQHPYNANPRHQAPKPYQSNLRQQRSVRRKKPRTSVQNQRPYLPNPTQQQQQPYISGQGYQHGVLNFEQQFNMPPLLPIAQKKALQMQNNGNQGQQRRNLVQNQQSAQQQQLQNSGQHQQHNMATMPFYPMQQTLAPSRQTNPMQNNFGVVINVANFPFGYHARSNGGLSVAQNLSMPALDDSNGPEEPIANYAKTWHKPQQ